MQFRHTLEANLKQYNLEELVANAGRNHREEPFPIEKSEVVLQSPNCFMRQTGSSLCFNEAGEDYRCS